MRARRRAAAAAALATLVAVSVPTIASATGEAFELECIGYAPIDTSVDIVADVTVGGAPYAGTATVALSRNPSDPASWTSLPVPVEDGFLYLPLDEWFAKEGFQTLSAKVTIGDLTKSCTVDYAQALVDYSGTFSVSAGATVHVLADVMLAFELDNPNDMPVADLQIHTASGWKTVASAQVTKYGYYALLNYKPVGWSDARLAVRSSGNKLVGISDTFLIDVNYGKTTLTSKPTSVTQGKTAAATARIGNHATSGKAVLQRKTGGTWVNVASKSFTGGAAKFTWSQKSTSDYRVVMTPAGKAASASTTFTVKHLPAVAAVPSTSSAAYGSTVGVTVTHRLTKTGTGKIQYYSSGAWRTYKSFTLSSSGTTKTSLKVTTTRKWRVVVGDYSSASFTVTKR